MGVLGRIYVGVYCCFPSFVLVATVYQNVEVR